MWTQDDLKFLRGLRITADAMPEPLPRFRVEPAKEPGAYRVIDHGHRLVRLVKVMSAGKYPDPRAAAETLAAELTKKYGIQESGSVDHA